MLNLDNIVCITLRNRDDFQIFALSEKYQLFFEALIELRDDAGNLPGDFTGKILVDLDSGYIVASEYIDEHCEFVTRGGSHKRHYEKYLDIWSEWRKQAFSKREIDMMKSLKPVRIPKIKKTPQALYNYTRLLEKGYKVKNESFDNMKSSYKKAEDEEHIAKLNELMNAAVNNEEYEKAAELRDMIKSFT